MSHTIFRTSKDRTEWKNQHTAPNSKVTHQAVIWYLCWCDAFKTVTPQNLWFYWLWLSPQQYVTTQHFFKFSVVHFCNNQQLFRAFTMINSCIQCHGTCLCPAKVNLQSSTSFCFVSGEPMAPKRNCVTASFLIVSRRNNEFKKQNLIIVVSCITLYSGEISPTRRNNCVFYLQWLYSTCFGWQSHPSSGVQCSIWPQVSWLT